MSRTKPNAYEKRIEAQAGHSRGKRFLYVYSEGSGGDEPPRVVLKVVSSNGTTRGTFRMPPKEASELALRLLEGVDETEDMRHI